MEQPLAATVDVRDMLCAQALAQAGTAMRRLAVGQALEVRGNAADVREDLVIWAGEMGHILERTDAQGDVFVLRIRRGAKAS